jgi:hypothetical protein
MFGMVAEPRLSAVLAQIKTEAQEVEDALKRGSATMPNIIV